MSQTSQQLVLFFTISLLLTAAFLLTDNNVILSNAQTDIDAPVAVIQPFVETNIGDSVEFNGSRSYDPGNEENISGGIMEWTWFIRSMGEDYQNQSIFGNDRVFQYVFQVPGDYIINLTVTDMSGNTGWIDKIFVVGGPDLQVISIFFSDPNFNDFRKGDTPSMTVAYTNSGTVAINSPWQLSITDETNDVITVPILGTIPPGDIRYFNHSGYELRSGDREFKVILDVDDDIDEMAEENNILKTKVTVQGGGSSTILENGDSSPVLALSVIIILIVLIVFVIIVVPVIIIVIVIIVKSKKKK